MNDKCVCGHYFNNHQDGPIKVEYTRFAHMIKENRMNCRDCDCPKYRKKYFWSKKKIYSLKEKK